METVATSVRISGDAIDLLTRLSKMLNQPKAQVVEIALERMEEHMFWQEVRESFDRIAADPEESARQKEEVELWERGTAGDLAGEEW